MLLCAGTLLAACGGDNTPTPQPDPYEQQFNTYLPLAVGASLSYNDSNFGNIDSMHILDEALSQAVGTDVRAAAVAVIGPVTGGTARALGLTPAMVATEHTIPGLVSAIRAGLA